MTPCLRPCGMASLSGEAAIAAGAFPPPIFSLSRARSGLCFTVSKNAFRSQASPGKNAVLRRTIATFTCRAKSNGLSSLRSIPSQPWAAPKVTRRHEFRGLKARPIPVFTPPAAFGSGPTALEASGHGKPSPLGWAGMMPGLWPYRSAKPFSGQAQQTQDFAVPGSGCLTLCAEPSKALLDG